MSTGLAYVRWWDDDWVAPWTATRTLSRVPPIIDAMTETGTTSLSALRRHSACFRSLYQSPFHEVQALLRLAQLPPQLAERERRVHAGMPRFGPSCREAHRNQVGGAQQDGDRQPGRGLEGHGMKISGIRCCGIQRNASKLGL